MVRLGKFGRLEFEVENKKTPEIEIIKTIAKKVSDPLIRKYRERKYV